MKNYPACKDNKYLISVKVYFACWVTLHAFLSSALFSKLFFFSKIHSGTLSECHTVWNRIRLNIFFRPNLG